LSKGYKRIKKNAHETYKQSKHKSLKRIYTEKDIYFNKEIYSAWENIRFYSDAAENKRKTLNGITELH